VRTTPSITYDSIDVADRGITISHLPPHLEAEILDFHAPQTLPCPFTRAYIHVYYQLTEINTTTGFKIIDINIFFLSFFSNVLLCVCACVRACARAQLSVLFYLLKRFIYLKISFKIFLSLFELI